MISASQLDWLKLILSPGLGPAGIHKLLDHFGTARAILHAPVTDLAATGISNKICNNLKAVDDKRLQASVGWLESSPSHHLLSLEDPRYPALLKTIDDAPPVLFVKGDPSLLSSLQLAIVGSRNASNHGIETAHEFARYLAKAGLTITSGLALGIDGAGHRGALDADGLTIAVTGNGLDRVYPAKHRELAHQIAERGALVSEFPPGTKPLPGHFPRRNRIIAGLSLGTLVVEAAQQSGSLITAYKALDQSREVFAIPGSIHNPLARGCHQLIRQGAKLVETAHDILEELAPLAQASLELEEEASETESTPPTSDESHALILKAMGHDPVSIDSLIERTGMSSNNISSILLILELEGRISAQSGGHYIRSA